jgi:hypothetical protein
VLSRRMNLVYAASSDGGTLATAEVSFFKSRGRRRGNCSARMPGREERRADRGECRSR